MDYFNNERIKICQNGQAELFKIVCKLKVRLTFMFLYGICGKYKLETNSPNYIEL